MMNVLAIDETSRKNCLSISDRRVKIISIQIVVPRATLCCKLFAAKILKRFANRQVN